MEYKQALCEVSHTWKTLPQTAKDDYKVRAEFEHQMRLECVNTALSSKGSQAPEIESHISSSGLKKISAARLQKNFEQAKDHPIWKSSTQLGDRAWPGHLHFVVFLIYCDSWHCQLNFVHKFVVWQAASKSIYKELKL